MLRGVKVTSFAHQAAYCWHHHCPAGLSHVGQTGKERISKVDSFRVVTLKTEVQKWLWQQDVSCCKSFRSSHCELWPVPGPNLVTGGMACCPNVTLCFTWHHLPSLIYLKRIWELDFIYRVFQEEVLIFWEVIVSVVLSKKKCIITCVMLC